MKDATTGMRKVKVKSSDSQVYLIVAATPCFFKGNQTYSYSIKIDKDEKNN
jgi:hypothetical protein